MAQKIYHSINTFNAGEISELLYNREDIAKYKSACRILENAIPLVEGGAKKMPGTYFAGPALNPNAPSRLVSFQFSTDQGAILEFSPGIIRIWAPVSPGTWTLGLVLSGGTPIELVTPYTQQDLFQLDCSTQSADTLWVFHPNYPPACVERMGPSTWVYTTYPPGGPPPSPGNPPYRGTSDVITTGFDGIGVAILQITQSFPAVMITDAAFNYGDRVYINLCAGMAELNEGEFFVTPVLQTSDQAAFTGHIDDTQSTPGAGLVLTVTAVASGTILVGMMVDGPNVQPNTIITNYQSGSGGTGTYGVNIQQVVKAGTGMTGSGGFAYNLISTSPGDPSYGGLFTGSITGNVLTVTAVAAGLLYVGMDLYYPGVPFGLAISSFGTGTGGVGTYNLSASTSASSQNMSSVPVVSTAYLPYQGGGFAAKVIQLFGSTGNYPSCGVFYQNRLCFAGTDNKPNTFFGSVQGDYPDFIIDPNEDDHAIQFTLVSQLLDQILNAVGTPTALLLGTAGGVWAVLPGSAGSSLSQTSVSASKQTTIGVAQLQAQLVGDSAIFVTRSARQVMFLSFNFVTNEWDNYDLTRLNRQITISPCGYPSGVIQTAFQSEPYPIFWFVRGDGQLCGLVFNKQDQVFAWFRVNMIPEGGSIESVAVISGQGEEDMVVVSVMRTINGGVVRYVEYFYPQELFNNLSNAFFVHCGLQLNLGSPLAITNITNSNPCVVTAPGHNFANGSFVQIANVIGDQGANTGMWQVNQPKTDAYTVANSNPGSGTFQLLGVDSTTWGVYAGGGTALPVTNIVTGLTYLLGQTVVAVGDNKIILPPTQVTGDSITFQYYCAVITIGLPYTMTVQPTNPVVTSQVVSTRGQKQKPPRVTISLYQSLGGQYGVSLDDMYDITYGPESEGEVM